MPVPDRLNTCGLLVASLIIVSVPFSIPVVEGAYSTIGAQLVITDPIHPPFESNEKSVPETETPEKLAGPLVIERLSVRSDVVP